MPSMRCLMTAGDALKEKISLDYNCSYVAVNRIQSFDEILYILMNGTGVGFSVERQYISELPVVAEEFFPSDTVITVADSKMGWAKAFKELSWYVIYWSDTKMGFIKSKTSRSHHLKLLVVVHLGQHH